MLRERLRVSLCGAACRGCVARVRGDGGRRRLGRRGRRRRRRYGRRRQRRRLDGHRLDRRGLRRRGEYLDGRLLVELRRRGRERGLYVARELGGVALPPFGVFRERARDGLFERRGDAQVLRHGRRRLADVLEDHAGNVRGGEGRRAGEHLVEQRAQGVHVGARVQRFALALLRRHVVRRADDRAHVRQRSLGGHVAQLGDAEVHDLDALRRLILVRRDDDDVVRLDVAVDDVAAVGRADARAHAAHQCDGAPRLHPALSPQEVAQRLAADEFHDDVGEPRGAARLAIVVYGHDVRVVELRGGARLPAEALDERLVINEPRVQDFDRHLVADEHAACEIDRAHATRAELRDDLVLAVEHATGERVSRDDGRRSRVGLGALDGRDGL